MEICEILYSNIEGEQTMTFIFALFALFLSVVIFGAAYITRGLKAALVATGVTLFGFVVLYAGITYLIVNSMD